MPRHAGKPLTQEIFSIAVDTYGAGLWENPSPYHLHMLSCLHGSDRNIAVRSPDTHCLGTVCGNTTQAITLEQLTCKG